MSTSSTTSSGGIGRASALLASGTLVSRVLGFVKTAFLAYVIGQSFSSSADSFALANQLPNNIYALIAGGLLSAVLVPQIVKAAAHSDGGQTYINKVVTLGTLVFAVVTLIATLAAPLLVRVYADQASDTGSGGYSPAAISLATAFAFWCLPQIFFYAMYSLLSEVLNARQVFGPFTWAPVINNVVALAGLGVFLLVFGQATGDASGGTWNATSISLLAGTATLGVVAQAAFLLLFWRRAGLTFRPDFRWRGVGLGATGKAAGWLLGMVLITQLAGIVQSRVVSLGSSVGASNATVANSWLLFMLPHGIIAVSIGTAYFTRMSGHASRDDLRSLRLDISQSIRVIGLFMVFAAVALMVVAMPFARFFERDPDAVSDMATVLHAYLPGLILFSVLFMIQRVFYALHDQRTPFFMQLTQSVVFVGGALLAPMIVGGNGIAAAVAVATTVAGTVQAVIALVLLHRRLGGYDGLWIVRRYVQYLVVALVAGAFGVFIVTVMGGYTVGGFGQQSALTGLTTVIVAGVAMSVVYFGVLTVFRLPELESLTKPVVRRASSAARRLVRR
ncbi:murein biosynthesis integral membrane protein MurJ [Frigoribacterium sp. 2-23]|uniref:murein biosynthesis integral membrane protein MurJ n=1 Tax=Frigoribacterium sp. 2-23 TaxID=3415006 RepID=UPI003C6FFC68